MGMSKSNRFITQGIVGLALWVGTGAAGAATITVDPLNPVYVQGQDPITLTIIGQDFTAGTNGSTSGGSAGGGLLIGWDPTILDLDSYVIDPAGNFDEYLAPEPVESASSLAFSVASYFGTTLSDFSIATLTFLFVGTGTSNTDITVSALDVWADYDGLINMTPTGVDGSVTVNPVPLPPAVLLFGTALVGLGFVSRRRKQAAVGSGEPLAA